MLRLRGGLVPGEVPQASRTTPGRCERLERLGVLAKSPEHHEAVFTGTRCDFDTSLVTPDPSTAEVSAEGTEPEPFVFGQRQSALCFRDARASASQASAS